jgi:hypothetical protein
MPSKKVGTLKTCSRGHEFYKSSDCPICPVCWSSYYKEKHLNDFPKNMSAPALRALLNAKITNLKELSKYSKKEILKLHGMGPASIPTLEKALKTKGLSFKTTV